MQPDNTTLHDLSFFSSGTENIFGLIDFTITQMGKDALRKHVHHPPKTFETLVALQESVRYLAHHPEKFPAVITNGTLVMVEKFFESSDGFSTPPSGIQLMFGNQLLKLFNRQEYFFTQFSISHLADFLKGCMVLIEWLEDAALPDGLRTVLQEIKSEMEKQRLIPELLLISKDTPFRQLSKLSFKARRELKNTVQRLMQLYATLDAWRSMGKATLHHQWTFPGISNTTPTVYNVTGLYHPLLKKPVSYDAAFQDGKNMLLLTGANMSGKTTFMRALGVCALLAHLGMGVPANACTISFLKGIITNMHVEDNLLRGESYFFAEVQRMKTTAKQLLQPMPNLVLMDELFKGTNVHDAYECTRAVLDGLLKHKHHIMVLSTHLYEVAEQFKNEGGIQLAYFVTSMKDDSSYSFSYALKEGISTDRIGYRILQKEGVIDLLNQHPQ